MNAKTSNSTASQAIVLSVLALSVLDLSVDKIVPQLKEASNLDELYAAEAGDGGKNRVTLLEAIDDERDARAKAEDEANNPPEEEAEDVPETYQYPALFTVKKYDDKVPTTVTSEGQLAQLIEQHGADAVEFVSNAFTEVDAE